MGVWETITMAINALRANKLRSALTLVGIVIGVFAVIASVTAVDVIDLYFNESLKFYGSSTLSVQRYAPGRGGDEEVYHPAITYSQVKRLERMASSDLRVSKTERFANTARVTFQGRETDPNIWLEGTDEHFLGNYGYTVRTGRPISAEDVQNARPVALIGGPIAEELFPNQSPIGKRIEVGRVRLEVIGVLEEKGGFLGFDYDTRVYAPLPALMGVYGNNGRNIGSVTVAAPTSQQLADANDEVISHMRVIRQVDPGAENNFSISTNDSVQSSFDTFTQTLTLGGAAIGLISLLAAGIGIMNILLVSVTERTREIGVRKAVGAKRRHILQQFLLEAVVLCQLGGLVGIALGGLAGNIVAVQFDISPSFPWGWAIGAIFGMTLVAVVFGLYPAYKAAGLDPIESLRYE